MAKTVFASLLLASALFAQPFEEAKKKFAAGEFRAATEQAAKVPERDENFARARYLMGEIALLLGDPKEAVEDLRAARKAKPGSAPILTALGRALIETDEHTEAAKVLKEAVKLNGKSGRAHCFLGIALWQETFGKKGGAEIDKGVKLAPDDAVVARAAVLFWLDEDKSGKAAKAADAYRKRRKQDPMGYFLRALVLERNKDYGEAIAAYQKAIELDDNFLDAHKNLAILCVAQNPLYRDRERTELAMKHLERYRELGGKDAALIQIHETLKKVLPQITGGR